MINGLPLLRVQRGSARRRRVSRAGRKRFFFTRARIVLGGNLGLLSEENHSYLSDKGREFVHGFWRFAAFLVNPTVFLMIGVDLASTPFSDYGQTFLCAVVGVVLIARAITVYPLSALFLRTRWLIGFGQQHMLWWGGVRGALGLALALSLPQSFRCGKRSSSRPSALSPFPLSRRG